jgi:CrcB protein
MSLNTVLLVGAGGFIGSIARYVTVQSVDRRLNSLFPYGTLTVNILGSLILGMVISFLAKRTGISSEWKFFLATGFCGGFTTFSAFAYENYSLLEQRLTGTAIIYILASLVFGILAMALGMLIGKMI